MNDTVRQAAESLADELSHFPWLVSVGIGKPEGRDTLYVYVKSLQHPQLDAIRSGFKGFPVIIEKTGAIRPALPSPQVRKAGGAR